MYLCIFGRKKAGIFFKNTCFLLFFGLLSEKNAYIIIGESVTAFHQKYDTIRERETMELIKTGMAGTVESGDILVEVEKTGAQGVEIQLDSTVMGLYGRQIRQVIQETVAQCGVDGIKVTASDKGALDCTIRARVKTAILRACDSCDYGWTVK